jgi:hypothetical protein
VRQRAGGREIRDFDESKWVEHRYRIVVAANLAKFSHNKELGEFLLNTNDRVLVEVSPVDSIWGIDLTADDPAVEFPNSWCGINLLGFAPMQVRERLLEGR